MELTSSKAVVKLFKIFGTGVVIPPSLCHQSKQKNKQIKNTLPKGHQNKNKQIKNTQCNTQLTTRLQSALQQKLQLIEHML